MTTAELVHSNNLDLREEFGTLRLRLTEATGSCLGTWSYGADRGVWSLACEKGVTATGIYVRESRNHGRGERRDSTGRKVEFVYGP